MGDLIEHIIENLDDGKYMINGVDYNYGIVYLQDLKTNEEYELNVASA